MPLTVQRQTSEPRSPWAGSESRARALEGDLDSLIEQSRLVITTAPVHGDNHGRADVHSLDPALWPAFDLASREFADVRDLVRPADWRRAFYSSTARWLEFEAAIEELSLRLTVRGVPWLPIKGYDVATRFYPDRELRTLSDIDILISAEDLERACRTLEAGGWRPIYTGDRSEDYLRREGYCWPMVSPSGVLVELHTRFWGLVPSGFEIQVFDSAVRLRQAGNELRPSEVNSWILASVHSWFDRQPRTIKGFRDLEWIARGVRAEERDSSFLDQLEDTLCEWDLQLLGALSSIACHRLFGNELHAVLIHRLEAHLKRPEARLVAQLRSRGPDAISFSQIARSRLLAKRRSRAGYRAIFRQIWAHPAVVERETAADRPFWIRRLTHMTRWFRRPQQLLPRRAYAVHRTGTSQQRAHGGRSSH